MQARQLTRACGQHLKNSKAKASFLSTRSQTQKSKPTCFTLWQDISLPDKLFAIYFTSALSRHTSNNIDPILTPKAKLKSFILTASTPLCWQEKHSFADDLAPFFLIAGSLGADGITSNRCLSGERLSCWWGHGPLHNKAGLSAHTRGPRPGLSTQDRIIWWGYFLSACLHWVKKLVHVF